jgi:hypothetical protein
MAKLTTNEGFVLEGTPFEIMNMVTLFEDKTAKAQSDKEYIKELEARLDYSEDENADLREQLEALRAKHVYAEVGVLAEIKYVGEENLLHAFEEGDLVEITEVDDNAGWCYRVQGATMGTNWKTGWARKQDLGILF